MDFCKKWDIIGLGAIAVDDLLYVASFPQPNSKIEVLQRVRQGGGLTGTALVAASRLGASTAYMGMLGNNDLSDFTRKEFSKEHVDFSLCPQTENARPIYSSIIVDQSSGDRTILYSLENFAPPPPESVPDDLPGRCKLLFLDTYFLSLFPYLINSSRACKTPVIADVESRNILNHPGVIDEIDYLILSKDLAAEITRSESPKDILEGLTSPNRRCTVVTEGKNGCWFKEKGSSVFHMPSFPVNAVDTTGCGDVFHGAYAAAIVRGESNTTCVIQASAAAAIKATRPGGRAGIPNLQSLQKFISVNSNIIPHKVP